MIKKNGALLVERDWGNLIIMTGVAVLGGEGPWNQKGQTLAQGADLLVAADSGMDPLFQWGIKPHLWLGDMDSAASYPPGWTSDIHQQRHPVDKDDTDAELAVKYLESQGCGRIVLLGGGGGRPDHFTALWYLMAGGQFPALRHWYTREDLIFPVEGEWIGRGEPGKRISLFPAWEETLFSTQGFHWDLSDEIWGPQRWGISNRFDRNEVRILVKRGKLMVILDEGVSREG